MSIERPLEGTFDESTGLLSAPCCAKLAALEGRVLHDILADVHAAGTDESVYTGGPGIAFLLVKAAAMRGEPSLLEKAAELLQRWERRVHDDARRYPDLGCSLLCGVAGWLCVEALRCHVADNRAGMQRACTAYAGLARTAASSQLDADEWLYGRAGYLHGCLLLRHVCGAAVVPEEVLAAVSDTILANGQAYATRRGSDAPLLWAWKREEYLGAAHGVMGIIFMLLQLDSVLRDAAKRKLVVDTIDWLLRQKATNGNWPAVHGERQAYLVHFCHGAPGAVHLLCKAYEVFGESRYLREAEAAGELVWNYGKLKKGCGVCHGFSGNGYVFLALFRASRDPKWLLCSYHYATLMFEPSVVQQCRTPDNPLSLFEGTAGAACFLLDLRLAPMCSAVPLFEVGWLKAGRATKLHSSGPEESSALQVLLHNQALSPTTKEATSEEFEVESCVTRALGATIGVAPEDIDHRENQVLRRMDSMMICEFNNRLLDEMPPPRRRVRPRLVFDHPNVKSMVACLTGRCRCLICRETMEFGPVLDEDSSTGASMLPPSTRPSTGSGTPPAASVAPTPKLAAFTQLLDLAPPRTSGASIYEPAGPSRFLRQADGMTCVLLPAATAWIGDGLGDRTALPIERPCHQVALRQFLMDVEPVSIGAYARFLNTVKPPPGAMADWLMPDVSPGFPARAPPVRCRESDGVWVPLDGVPPTWPMINVTWYGANAYSMWANGRPWHGYKEAESSCLPSEAQWEYAARGAQPSNFPWGDEPASAALLNVRWDPWPLDLEVTKLRPQDFPLTDVNCQLGVSPFGIRHMAGTVWQWCRDTFRPDYYGTPEATQADACCLGVAEEPKGERGGSWVGPPALARSSYRRGRPAHAKGPCLGFRCVGQV